MWPFSEMSLSAASLVGTIANWALLASLIGGVVSTFVIVKTADVKEEHWAEDRRRSNEKIAESAEHIAALGVQGDEARAELGVAQADIAKAKVQAAVQEKETAKARQAIVEANARAAEANARALEAQAALERFKAPRKLEGSQIERFKAAVAGFPGTPFDIMVNLESEPQGFAAQIGELLESVEWVWKDRNNTPGLAINIGKHQAGMLNGGPALGIEIDSSKDKDWAGAVLALGGAFLVEGIQPVMNKANDGSASPDAVHLYFGSKR
jgi:hypothetical protein